MRVVVLTNDTRGGVQPYAVLAAGLRAAGLAVSAVAPAELAPLFAGRGVPVTPLTGTSEAMALAASGFAERGTLATMRLSRRELPRRLQAWMETTRSTCEGAGLIVAGIGGLVIGSAVAAQLGIPVVAAHLQPVAAPTAAYPGVLLPGVPGWLGPVGRWASHLASDAALQLPFRAAARQAAMALFGSTRQATPVLTLYGFSRHVVPLPETANRRVTGYWQDQADAAWEPPARLAAFLSDGKPTVSVGFGSIGSADPEALAAIAITAARRQGLKLVLLRGWNGLSAAEAEDVLSIDAAPHGWLFQRMTAVVHHGGAGTTGAGLLAGIPNIVVPVAVDQPFWGSRVAALGVGPKPIPRRVLSADRLAGALAEATAPAMAARARELAARMAEERGLEQAVALIAAVADGLRPE